MLRIESLPPTIKGKGRGPLILLFGGSDILDPPKRIIQSVSTYPALKFYGHSTSDQRAPMGERFSEMLSGHTHGPFFPWASNIVSQHLLLIPD